MYWQQIPSNSFESQSDARINPSAGPLRISLEKDIDLSHSREELTDGQISIALNSDLLNLINSISSEVSRLGLNTDVADSHKPRQRFKTADSYGASTSGRTHASGISPRHRDIDSENWRSLDPVTASWLPPVASSPSGAHRSSYSSSPRHGSYVSSTSIEVEPLPQVLDQLDDENDDCVVVVRRITKLGFKSNRLIKAAFGELGWKIKNVVLLPSRSKVLGEDHHIISSHARPSSMGFVVFTNKADAQTCLKQSKYMIDGIEILVQPFSRQYKSSPTHATRTY